MLLFDVIGQIFVMNELFVTEVTLEFVGSRIAFCFYLCAGDLGDVGHLKSQTIGDHHFDVFDFGVVRDNVDILEFFKDSFFFDEFWIDGLAFLDF